jgi:hypothetical protein
VRAGEAGLDPRPVAERKPRTHGESPRLRLGRVDPLEWLACMSDHAPDPGQHRTLLYVLPTDDEP